MVSSEKTVSLRDGIAGVVLNLWALLPQVKIIVGYFLYKLVYYTA